MSELSRRSGVPIPTIKFYLREKLLPPGHRTAPNQARYGEAHLRRLRLIRVLQEVGGMPLAGVRVVLGALAQQQTPLHEALAAAHMALRHSPPKLDPLMPAARDDTDAWLQELGWNLAPASPAREDLAGALVALRQLGWEVGPEVFERYAGHAHAIAEAEIAYVSEAPDREAAVETTVIGTVVFEQALLALRRLAQEHHSRKQFGQSRRSGA